MSTVDDQQISNLQYSTAKTWVNGMIKDNIILWNIIIYYYTIVLDGHMFLKQLIILSV